MSLSAPLDTMPPLFKSLTALRSAHTSLLKEYQKHDDDGDENRLPESFITEVELFLQRASSSGALLDIDEDRADAQALLNYWTTVLYNAGQTPRPTVLANFEEEVASRQVGERCPYRGLQAFHLEDRPYFYGRRQLVREMTKWLQRENFLAVVGLSGSGKSSIVRAGLIPALQEGALSDSESWTYYDTIVPGSEPLRSLSELTRPEGVTTEQWHRQHAPQFLQDEGHLLRLVSGGGKTAVVVVDQFEELFTLSQDEAERRAFVANLIRLTQVPDRCHIVIITMRSEFDTYVARLPELQELFERAQIRVSPLSPLDLRKAIEKPAERSGLSFEAGLVEELVQQVLGEPAGLPLLQFTLYKLWEKRQGKDITWAIYRELGGSPREVLARVADATYESFNIMEDRNISRRIMLRLVRPGAGLDVTSNRVRRESLYPVGARDNVNRVLDIWVAAGLLRVTPATRREDDQVEVMHEALIRNWPELVTWVEKERVNLRQRLQLTSAAQQWAEHQRDPGGLLGGTLLAEALTYDDLNELEKEFVTASQKAAAEVEREKQRHQQRLNALRKFQLIFGSIFLVVALGLLTWALWQTKKAYAASYEANKEKANALTAKGLADKAKTEADLATGEINKTRADAAAEIKNIKDEANKELNALKQQKDTELGKLKGYEAQAAKARKIVDEYEAKALAIKTDYEKRARDAKIAADAEKAEINKELQITSTILSYARPAILIENGKLNTLPDEWRGKLEPRRVQIEKMLAGVGRLESVGEPDVPFITAFLIAPDVAVVASYAVEDSPGATKKFLIDFREKPDTNKDAKFATTIIGEVVVKTRQTFTRRPSLTLLRVEKRSASGLQLPPPLVLAKEPNLREGQPIYVVGYPVYNSVVSSELINAVFKNIFDVKRLQPGYLLSLIPSELKFTHDCFTLGGNAGSPVVNLETGQVIGVHLGGQAPTAASPGRKEAVALWMLKDDPMFINAGVTFQ
jgi:type II secretory pathway predicted ATPase ExeA